MIYFEVPAVPVPQPRQRHAVRQFGGRATAVNYTPTKHPVNDFKATVRMAAQAAYRGEPLGGPLALSVDFTMPRPASLRWKRRPMPELPHIGRPDLDNLGKSVMDALKGLLWHDDSQVCDLRLCKSIAAGDERPHVTVSLQEFKGYAGDAA